MFKYFLDVIGIFGTWNSLRIVNGNTGGHLGCCRILLAACQNKGAFVKIYADSSVQTAMDAVSALDEELNKAADWIVKQ